MTADLPQFEIRVQEKSIRTADEAVSYIKERLAQRTGWVARDGALGTGLAHLFGRLAELTFNRVNQVPEKHFVAFLNGAGIDLLPPRAAKADLTFTPAPDTTLVRVPVGTQVATVKTETQPEVIFETEKALVVAPNELKRCIAFDALNYSDCTANAAGKTAGAFLAFAGKRERQRVLYLGDSCLFTFKDDSERHGATIELLFKLAELPLQLPLWRLAWEYYDEEDADWVEISPIRDTTLRLLRSGEIEFGSLPVIGEHAIAEGAKEWKARWLRARLTHLSDARALPRIDTILARKRIAIQTPELAPDACFYHVPASGVYIPLDPHKEFYPLGSRPGRHDTFYMAADEALSKPGATVTLSFDIAPFGLPADKLPSDVFSRLEVVWSYYDGQQWRELGHSVSGFDSLAQSLNSGFTDNTNAFTAEGADKQVTFTVPDGAEVDSLGAPLAPPPQSTVVNELEHYWVRARLVAGFYGKEGTWDSTDRQWVPEALYPPLVRSLTLTYTLPSTVSTESAMETCLGFNDGAYSDYSLASQKPAQIFAPFSPREEGPALYLGFEQAFPKDEWIQLLVDVEQVPGSKETSPVSWEYWSGEWSLLRVSDGTDSLRKRGYVGFFGPRDHTAGDEFGYNAYWLRIRPYKSPMADAGASPPAVFTTNDKAAVTLNASRSKAFAGHVTTEYVWRTKPTANGGENQLGSTQDAELTVTLDASGSKASPGRSIAKYVWNRKRYTPRPMPVADAGADMVVGARDEESSIRLDASRSLLFPVSEEVRAPIYRWNSLPPEPEDEPPETIESPWLKTISINTVAASNAETIHEEILGSSNDKPGQEFGLLRTPVLAGAAIYVRELDRPPDEELGDLRVQLSEQDPEAEPLLANGVRVAGEGVWVRWHEVSDFHGSGPASRHFTLDPISGRLRFGDGVHGKIPPLGRDNIKVALYRTHDGAAGNAATGEITVLRNPSGDLANIESVRNREAAAGGSGEESREQVEGRGPQTLKHRNRAVTLEDFEWLAREASSEIAIARCLPVRDPLGLQSPGWVTMVITPQSTAIKPTPSPALLRTVRYYLQDRALVSLKDSRQVHVKGPDYVEVSVLVEVVPGEPEKSDETELKVLARLEEFLHPLSGGPRGKGWDLGRDVYLSEVYTEIEAAGGVDHARHLRLRSSLQQFYLNLDQQIVVPFDIPAGGQVGTFDERIKLVLAETLLAPAAGLPGPASIGVFGFNTGERAEVVADDGRMLVSNLTIASIADERITFQAPFTRPAGWDGRGNLMSADGRVRLPLVPGGEQVLADKRITGVAVTVFQAGDEVSIVSGRGRDPRLEFLALREVKPCEDRIFVPEGHLIYAGSHDVRMRLE